MLLSMSSLPVIPTERFNMKYRVDGEVTISVSIEVEAASPEDALEKADEQFGGVRNYVGNGGFDKLIGVQGTKESIQADYAEIAWIQPYPAQ